MTKCSWKVFVTKNLGEFKSSWLVVTCDIWFTPLQPTTWKWIVTPSLPPLSMQPPSNHMLLYIDFESRELDPLLANVVFAFTVGSSFPSCSDQCSGWLWRHSLLSNQHISSQPSIHDMWTSAIQYSPTTAKKSLICIELSKVPCSPDLSMINDSLLWGIQYPPHAVFQQFLSTTQLPPPTSNLLQSEPSIYPWQYLGFGPSGSKLGLYRQPGWKLLGGLSLRGTQPRRITTFTPSLIQSNGLPVRSLDKAKRSGNKLIRLSSIIFSMTDL